MRKINTTLEGLYVIELEVFSDNRGFFTEYFNKRKFKEILGKDLDFVQDNYSYSKQRVIRGLHAQPGQAKLVGVVHGSILDAAVDIRKNSKTYGQIFTIELSENNNKLLLIPDGFLHGFQALTTEAKVFYKVTDFYNPSTQFGVRYDDIDINWPLPNPILTTRDLELPSFKDVC